MKSKSLSIQIDDIKIKGPSERMAQLLIAGLLTQALPPAANVQTSPPPTTPGFGEYWPGQGGYNGGLVAARGDVPAHYLIIAKEDVGDHKWGGYGDKSTAVSKTDGMANTGALLAEGDHPAAERADSYEADGHKDFYLPAASELYQGWLNCPEVFAQDCYYWSSSQRSADDAFYMLFVDGIQSLTGKGYELRVRPVRRFFI